MRQFKCQYCTALFRAYKLTSRFCSRYCFYKSGIAHRGHRHSEITINKLRSLSKNNEKVMSTSFKNGHKNWDNQKVKANWFKKGHKPANWMGGVRTPSQVIKDDPRYINWRKAVFKRDNYTCVLCNARNVELNADHIFAKVKYRELAFNIDNGRTLCIPCHRLTPNYGGSAIKYENISSTI